MLDFWSWFTEAQNNAFSRDGGVGVRCSRSEGRMGQPILRTYRSVHGNLNFIFPVPCAFFKEKFVESGLLRYSSHIIKFTSFSDQFYV